MYDAHIRDPRIHDACIHDACIYNACIQDACLHDAYCMYPRCIFIWSLTLMRVYVWCIYLWTSSLDPDAWMYDARMYDYISMILVPWPWCMYDTWMYDAHIHDLCPWCMYDAKMYDAHIRDSCPWSWCMHDACILVLECMMHTPAAAPPIENRIKKRYEHTFNGRSSSRSEQGYYGVGIHKIWYIIDRYEYISGLRSLHSLPTRP